MLDAFSTTGRTPRSRFIVTLALAYAVCRLVGLAWEASSIFLVAAAGLVLGAALAKAAAEGTRRLHDMGTGVSAGLVVALVLGLAEGCAHLAALARDDLPLVSVADALALAALAVLALWPGRKAANSWGDAPASPWAGTASVRGGWSVWVLPLLGIGGVEAVVAALALFGWGMERSNQRAMDYVRRSQAQHEQGVTVRGGAGERP